MFIRLIISDQKREVDLLMDNVVRSRKAVFYTILDGVMSTAVLQNSLMTSNELSRDLLRFCYIFYYIIQLLLSCLLQQAINKDENMEVQNEDHQF